MTIQNTDVYTEFKYCQEKKNSLNSFTPYADLCLTSQGNGFNKRRPFRIAFTGKYVG